MKSYETVKVLKPIIRPADSKDYPLLRQMLYKVLGYKKLSLSVDKANRVVNLYKRLEFKVIKKQEADFLMVKYL